MTGLLTSPQPDSGEFATPFVPWERFHAGFGAAWQQGEHVTMIGTTGCGKTTLGLSILGFRDAVVAFGTKARDETMDKLVRAGYWKTKEWNPDVDNYVVLWPEIRGAGHIHVQRDEFARAIDSIFRSGGWCVFLDEVSYLSDLLGMQRELKFLLNQGRSAGISVIGATQRPAFIPLAFYDQASHLFFFRDNDHKNLARIGELSGLHAREVQREVAVLPKHEFLYYNKDTGYRVRSKVEV